MKAPLLTLALFFSATLFAAEKKLVLQPAEFGRAERHKYFTELLALALKSGDPANSYKFTGIKKDQPQSQNVISVQKNEIDVIWTMTSQEREKDLLPIRVPLDKGMIGWRVCLVKKDKVDQFKGISSAADFIKQGKTVGQGFDWPDVDILQKNNIKVVKSPTYEDLFSMLADGKFDCFARAINEPWEEIEKFGKDRFEVEKHIAFLYRSPIYFFVKKDNVALAKSIDDGLEHAIKDGSFDQHFMKYNGTFIEKAKLKDRVQIFLRNPDLTKESEAVAMEKKYWLKIK